MLATARTVAFQGIEARPVEVQCAVSPGLPAFSIVGLPDKAVSEARERVRAAICALGLALPAKRITVNLSPADLPKEGSHFDLPIALALLAAMDVVPAEDISGQIALGELSLGGELVSVLGALPAALTAGQDNLDLICPAACGAEAAWVDAVNVIAPRNLLALVNHFTGKSILPTAKPGRIDRDVTLKDMAEVKGQERAKRALEIAAAGRHHVLMIGAPGAGKSMMAECVASILPPLTPAEALETSMVHSRAGLLGEAGISYERPFMNPHHTASMAAIVGGGRNANPGEISLAHNGVLFMDELPEFPRQVLETLRQPLETGSVVVSRANAHVRYPCRFLLLAAANPCRCGHLADPDMACAKAPICGQDYMARVSGPLMDRFDMRVEIPKMSLQDLAEPATGETSAVIGQRVAQARDVQAHRFANHNDVRVNADMGSDLLDALAKPDAPGQDLLNKAAEKFRLSARGYHRILRMARTIADLEGKDGVTKAHIGEAIGYRVSYLT